MSSEIRVRSTYSNKVAINEYILHKSIGRGSYAQIRAGYDLIAEKPVAIRIINRKNLARKIGLSKTDQMVANSCKIHLMLKKSIQLYQLIYTPKIFQQLEDQSDVPVSHQLYNNFKGPFTLKGELNYDDQLTDQPSLRSTTPRYSNEYNYDNCVIQVMELANSGTLKDLDATLEQLQELLLQVASCVQEMHMLNVIHADLKADNIVLVENCKKLQAKLTDFDTSIILNKSHSKNLQFMRYQDIFAYDEISNFSFIIIDAFRAEYVGEIITTPAISAPETKSFANVFKGKMTDLWQFGQLFLQQYCGNSKNMSLLRGSTEYNVVAQEYSEEVADIISGLTEYNSAYRYESSILKKHGFFSSNNGTISQFHIAMTNLKAKSVIQDDFQLIQVGDDIGYARGYKLLHFWQSLFCLINTEVITAFSTAGEVFTLRQTQCQRVENFTTIFLQAIRQIVKEIYLQYYGDKSVISKLPSITDQSIVMQELENYNIAQLYQFLTPEICDLLNKNQLMQRNLVEVIDIRDLKYLSSKQIYKAAKVLHYSNLMVRLAAFNLNQNYYDVRPLQCQQAQSTFEMSLTRRKQQLKRATAKPSKHVEVIQSFANLQAFIGKESTAPKKENITPIEDSNSDSDQDLPSRYAPITRSARDSISISVPKLNLESSSGAFSTSTTSQVEKKTFEHRELVLEQLPEVSDLDSQKSPYIFKKQEAQKIEHQIQLIELSKNVPPKAALSKSEVLLKTKSIMKDQHLDFENISSESSSDFEEKNLKKQILGKAETLKFEPINWNKVKEAKQNDIISCLSSETEDIYLTYSSARRKSATKSERGKDEENTFSVEKLFNVVKIDDVKDCTVEGSQFDIGDCSEGSDF